MPTPSRSPTLAVHRDQPIYRVCPACGTEVEHEQIAWYVNGVRSTSFNAFTHFARCGQVCVLSRGTNGHESLHYRGCALCELEAGGES